MNDLRVWVPILRRHINDTYVNFYKDPPPELLALLDDMTAAATKEPGARVVGADGRTSCCGAMTTYVDLTEVCKVCYEAVLSADRPTVVDLTGEDLRDAFPDDDPNHGEGGQS